VYISNDMMQLREGLIYCTINVNNNFCYEWQLVDYENRFGPYFRKNRATLMDREKALRLFLCKEKLFQQRQDYCEIC
jgi:hypothetical protein